MSLPLMIKELLNPDRYPEPTTSVELSQTHISFVLLTDHYVYKIKKPVDFGFLDFTSIDKRRFYCQQEVELNRRLAPEVYIDVVPVRERDACFYFGGEGELADYAVKMRRLPDDRMMIKLLKAGKVDEAMLVKIAEKIAVFHSIAKTDPIITACGSAAVVRKNVEENFSQTAKYLGNTVSAADFDRIKRYSETFLEDNKELLLKRMTEGRIRDCHGDLHMDHLYIMDKVYIIDCIEFNERFRYTDVAADIAFLAMDLDYYGEYELSDSFVRHYIEVSGDNEIMEVIDFYKCYRACVRAKVDSFELDDPNLEPAEKDEMRQAASKYFKLAARYAKP
ncbi:MAG: phosphotransferase [Proteobacteria bacterium]|nr:phosphotransferase [Pseudomonadota bacterium]